MSACALETAALEGVLYITIIIIIYDYCLAGRCDFENGDCSYTPGTGSDFNWNVIQPNSGGIAPPIDITYRTAAGMVSQNS